MPASYELEALKAQAVCARSYAYRQMESYGYPEYEAHVNEMCIRDRVMVVPATQKIYKQCIQEGLMDIFVDAGCAVNTPSCGPCMGGHMGVMAAGEKCVSTTNRNFVGRMGHVDSLIYLASPEVAAASAIAGYIANPEKVGDR